MKLTHEMCNQLFQQADIDTKRWIVNILAEINSAEEKHPHWPKDIIHQAAIVAEESGELVQAALNHAYEDGKYYCIHSEATQVSAMGIRMLKNLPKKNHPYEEKDNEPKFQQ